MKVVFGLRITVGFLWHKLAAACSVFNSNVRIACTIPCNTETIAATVLISSVMILMQELPNFVNNFLGGGGVRGSLP